MTKHFRKPSHSRPKRKLLKIIEIQEAIAGEIKQPRPKPLFSRIEELYFSREVKENALASEGKSCQP